MVRTHEITLPSFTDLVKQVDKDGYAEITLRIPAGLEEGPRVLRTRGTPIELIGSYLLGGDIVEAEAAFKNAVLENIYEHLRLEHRAHVFFCNSWSLTKKDSCVFYEELLPQRVVHNINLTENDGVSFDKTQAPLTSINLGKIAAPIRSTVQGTVTDAIQTITDVVKSRTLNFVQRRAEGPNVDLYLGIVPDLSVIRLFYSWDKPDILEHEVNVALFGYGLEELEA